MSTYFSPSNTRTSHSKSEVGPEGPVGITMWDAYGKVGIIYAPCIPYMVNLRCP